MTRELQVVGNAASIATRTWVRSNDKSKARAEEREKNIGWIGRMFTAWRVSHAERREELEADGEDDDEEDDTPVVIPSSAVTTYPKGTPVPTPSIKVQVIEERVDLSNNMTWRQMIGVGVRRVVLARGELGRLEGPKRSSAWARRGRPGRCRVAGLPPPRGAPSLGGRGYHLGSPRGRVGRPIRLLAGGRRGSAILGAPGASSRA